MSAELETVKGTRMAVVAVPGDEGMGSIQIELEEVSHGEVSDVYGDEAVRGVREKVTKLAEPLFGEAVDLVRSCAAQVRRKLDDMPDDTRPDEIELQFAVKLDTKFGARIAEATSGAQLQVLLRWTGRADG